MKNDSDQQVQKFILLIAFSVPLIVRRLLVLLFDVSPPFQLRPQKYFRSDYVSSRFSQLHYRRAIRICILTINII